MLGGGNRGVSETSSAADLGLIRGLYMTRGCLVMLAYSVDLGAIVRGLVINVPRGLCILNIVPSRARGLKLGGICLTNACKSFIMLLGCLTFNVGRGSSGTYLFSRYCKCLRPASRWWMLVTKGRAWRGRLGWKETGLLKMCGKWAVSVTL